MHGGIQVVVHPLKRGAYERMLRPSRRRRGSMFGEVFSAAHSVCEARADMGLAPGGRMKQEIYEDSYKFDDWDLSAKSRCFVHLANALVWREVTGENPPTTPPTAKEYTRAGLPWFEYYAADQTALGGASKFAAIKSVVQLGKDKGNVPLPENIAVHPKNVVTLRAGLAKNQVREGAF